jgi:hypothetical protein
VNQDDGTFRALTPEEAQLFEPSGKVFTVGEILKIKESYFLVKAFRDKRMNLKLLPTARGKEMYEVQGHVGGRIR